MQNRKNKRSLLQLFGNWRTYAVTQTKTKFRLEQVGCFAVSEERLDYWPVEDTYNACDVLEVCRRKTEEVHGNITEDMDDKNHIFIIYMDKYKEALNDIKERIVGEFNGEVPERFKTKDVAKAYAYKVFFGV